MTLTLNSVLLFLNSSEMTRGEDGEVGEEKMETQYGRGKDGNVVWWRKRWQNETAGGYITKVGSNTSDCSARCW